MTKSVTRQPDVSSSVQSATPLLKLIGIKKRFGGVHALTGVDLDLRAGEIHALLGENGAGKSTLIKVLGGVHQPDAGTIELAGEPITIASVNVAHRLGIRLIHQELCLVPSLSIAENLYLGREPTWLGMINRQAIRQAAQELIAKLGLKEIAQIDTLVADLSTAQQQLVEIARALSVDARILVLDEPTASLSHAETEQLFAVLDRLRKQQVGIIYISHRLDEIRRLADRLTVLRDGASMGTRSATNLEQQEIVKWMVGRDITNHYPTAQHNPSEIALKVEHLRNEWVDDVSFELRFGEVLGICGLVGAGRTELARTLFGMTPAQSGTIEIAGKPVTINSPSSALALGMVMVPEDRKREGLILDHTVGFNLALPWVSDWHTIALPNSRRRAEIVDRAINTFAIKTAHERVPARNLSGGNQQKIVIGKWFERPPRILILDEPTRGVDVGAREEIYHLIKQAVEDGMAVILISSDLPEVMNVAHRLLIYQDRKVIAEVDARQITPERVMELLTHA